MVLLAIPTAGLAHRVSPISRLAQDSINYNFIGPDPFKDLKVEIRLERPDGYSRKISQIVISIGNAVHTLDKQELKIGIKPKLEEIKFLYNRIDELKGELNLAWIEIPYGKMEYVDCGEDHRIGLFKTKKILISPYDAPQVLDDTTKYGICEKKEKLREPNEIKWE